MGADGAPGPGTVRLRVLGPGDRAVLGNVAPDVFDDPVRVDLVEEFLDDPRHHIVVALDGDVVVGFASAVHYVHPDKDPELWMDEVGVAPTHQGSSAQVWYPAPPTPSARVPGAYAAQRRNDDES